MRCSIDERRLEQILWQLGNVVVEEVDGEWQSERGVGEPEAIIEIADALAPSAQEVLPRLDARWVEVLK